MAPGVPSRQRMAYLLGAILLHCKFATVRDTIAKLLGQLSAREGAAADSLLPTVIRLLMFLQHLTTLTHQHQQEGGLHQDRQQLCHATTTRSSLDNPSVRQWDFLLVQTQKAIRQFYVDCVQSSFGNPTFPPPRPKLSTLVGQFVQRGKRYEKPPPRDDATPSATTVSARQLEGVGFQEPSLSEIFREHKRLALLVGRSRRLHQRKADSCAEND